MFFVRYFYKFYLSLVAIETKIFLVIALLFVKRVMVEWLRLLQDCFG